MPTPQSSENDLIKSKKKFVPKRRAPHLIQAESSSINNNQKDRQTVIEKRESLDSKESIRSPIGVNKESYQTSKGQPRRHLEDDELATGNVNYHEEASKLYGIQKKIAYFLAEKCVNRKDTNTGPITSEVLCTVSGSTYKTTKKILGRMIEKKLLSRLPGKKGKGGYVVFELRQEFIDIVRLQSQLEYENNYPSQIVSHQKSIVSTRGNASNEDLPAEWKQIDYSSVESIGFGLSQIKQLYEKSLNTPDVIQDSIHHFSFGLQYNPTVQKYVEEGKAINVFMGVLRKGLSWSEAKYESPKDKALRELFERRKLEKENRQKIIKELMSLEFDDWRSSLTEEELKRIIPESSYNSKLEAPKTVALQTYYENEILLPRLKTEGLL